MTIEELPELQEKSRNAAHTSAITPRVETNKSQPGMDHGQRGIAAGDGC